MKNKFLMVTFFSICLLFSSNVKAVNYNDNQTVDANKTWTVKFSDEIKFDELTKQGITVTDSKGDTVNVGVQLGQDNKSIMVTAPQSGYTPWESYILNVGDKVHSNKGKELKNECKLHFNIRETSSISTTESSSKKNTSNVQSEKNKETSTIKIKVTAEKQVMTATLIDNATTRSLISKFPLTVPMMNLYSREMCYRFNDPLPANEAKESSYEVGDLSYWTPGHSLVIFYKQNGEVISNLQKIGHFDSDVEIFKQTGDVNIKFELLDK